jgi:hypothetical protein
LPHKNTKYSFADNFNFPEINVFRTNPRQNTSRRLCRLFPFSVKPPSPNQDGISSSENARQNGKDGVQAEMDSGTRNRPAAYVEFRASKENQT